MQEEPDLDIDPTPVTPDTFYAGWTEPERIAPPASNEAIAAAERRLGIELPETLKRLYRQRNGGDTDAIWVPLKPDPQPVFEDWRACWAHGYDWLVPLERLCTLRQAYLEWVDPDDPEEAATIPTDADARIVLAMRYEDTTFLDYSKPGPPRVGVIDFEAVDRSEDVWFENFEAFLAALRRERD